MKRLGKCGGYGFYFITEDFGTFSPGIYAMLSGEEQDYEPDISLFYGRMSQMKLAWGPAADGSGQIQVQLFMNDSPLLKPLILPQPSAQEKSPQIVFEGSTADGCTQEQIIGNIEIWTDADLPDDYKGLFSSLLKTRYAKYARLSGTEVQARSHDHRVENEMSSYLVITSSLMVLSIFITVYTRKALRRMRYTFVQTYESNDCVQVYTDGSKRSVYGTHYEADSPSLEMAWNSAQQ
uniref:Uncharacterized protein n=1 Tax=Fibrocapsa japonica TaxID=94617 RepID=A0A7S2UZM0_9STRA|mmetsp:Transcript_21086/g.30591  ORF Transcript_21086/g.30591 Transcript_21086/m.30591 type:complete len:236 (+) Transcript_21086:2-709(+)